MSKLTLRSIRTRGAVVPLARPLPTKVVTLTMAPLVLVDIETEEGVTGHAYGFAYVERAIPLLRHLIADIGAVLAGQPLAPASQFDALLKRMTLMGHEGLTMMAISCFDMAAWDALARAAGLPLARLLGGAARPIPAYNSNGLGIGPVETLAEEALQLAEGGFKAVKLRVGRDTLAQDVAAIQTVKRALPAGVALMTDFNQALSVPEAIRRGRAFDAFDLDWIEEPVAYDDWAGQAKIAAEVATPIQIGENFYGPRAMATALAAKACDLAMPDAIRIGGVTGWLRAAALADAARMPMSSHLFPEISAHLLAATPTAHWLEYVDWANPILAQPLKLENGNAVLADRPGSGVEWNEDAVKRYAVDA
jgi:mandelate racemase